LNLTARELTGEGHHSRAGHRASAAY